MLVDIPEINLTFPTSPIIKQSFSFVKKHCDETTYNHTVRSAYWAIIISKKHPSFQNTSIDMENVIVSCILHDMGWAKTESLLSADKRFEVDGANIAKDFLQSEKWDEARVQRAWDAIALHATPSIAMYGAPEVALTNLGITAEFLGPNFPNGPGGDNMITMEEYKAVLKVFPRANFNVDAVTQIMCGLCRNKPQTTYDNFVGWFGLHFGTDGKGGGKEDYAKAWEENQSPRLLSSGLNYLQTLDEK
ncbi:metal dependent phosphohydrolase [Fusarium albosuccineum]|uniref:Metal dependent phosphohydrolase n=1 Tax=Fusarium albosuccineum TaxID=1237068 RepID=A0A8H4PF40_9HYPO|nr:metal dependent phosphohydrolase [Fusarium albosuccineum]